MHPELIEIMRARACTVYRALTGTDMPEPELSTGEPASEAAPPAEEVTRAFAELEALARTDPCLAERVPPFSFTPPLDAILDENGLTIEVAVPGIERSDVTVECVDGTLIISGIPRSRGAAAGAYSHAEIPRGPFYRAFRVPFAIQGEPVVDLEQGLLRVRLQTEQSQTEQSQTEQSQTNPVPSGSA
jgi:HSP20 family molecular chaperone IbpA